jgi:hypothetical protein
MHPLGGFVWHEHTVGGSLHDEWRQRLHRIGGRLPQGVAVADKTGSACGITNGVGLITLPEGAGTLAVWSSLRNRRCQRPTARQS